MADDRLLPVVAALLMLVLVGAGLARRRLSWQELLRLTLWWVLIIGGLWALTTILLNHR